MKSHSNIPDKTLFIDIETTNSFNSAPVRDTIVEIAIVDDEGRTVLHTLVNPERKLGESKKYTGIKDEDVKNKPTLRDLWPQIEAIVTGCHVVMYNVEHDIKFFPKNLSAAGHISCAMKRFAPIYGDYSKYHNDYTFKSLKDATAYIKYKWTGRQHRAIPDALATRAVWRWMEERDDFNGMPEKNVSEDNVISF